MEGKARARFEKARHTKWEQTGKSLECQDKGVESNSGGSEEGLEMLGRGSACFRKPALVEHGG